MDHSHIARVFDAGATEDGRPYRGPVAAAAVLAALVGGLVGTGWGVVEPKRQRDAADGARAAAVEDQGAARRAQAAEAQARVVADTEREVAKRAAVRADELQLGTESTTARRTDPGLALLLAGEAVRRTPHHLTFAALYDAAAELREEKTIRGVCGPLAVGPDGSLALTRSRDRTAALRDARTGRLRAVYRCPDHVRFAAFTRGGAGVVTASDGGSVRLWPLDPSAELAKRAPRALTPAEPTRYDLPAD